MEKAYRIKHNLKVILCALLTVVLLCSAIFIMVTQVYVAYRQESYEMLHMETRQIKRDINLQMNSDRENLITMANFAGQLYDEGEGFGLLFKSFEAIGLFEDVRILLPDNSFVTKMGTAPSSGELSFDEETKKGAYISGRVGDLVRTDKMVVRSAVPVTAKDGKIVAILYGIINLQSFENRYLDDVRDMGGDLFVIEQGNGNFIIDTKRENFGHVTELAATTFEDGYSYEELTKNLAAGSDGYTSFDSIVTGDKLVAHYAPLAFADWQIMVAKPESNVLKTAREIRGYMLSMAIALIVIMMAYVIVVFISERNNLSVNINASIIRKRLLEVNQNFDKIYEALGMMTSFAKARSAFFADSYGEECFYISPSSQNENLIVGEEREYFISELFTYVTKQQSKHGTNVYLTRVRADKKLFRSNSELYIFMKNHGLKSAHVASVTHNNSNVSMLCIINSGKAQIGSLLKDIAICFSMTIYNKKHLTNTESMALTDALTGVANRMAYKQDVKRFAKNPSEKFACIYIDVNELNYYNNKHGHAAGDRMLVFIAETLSEKFADGYVYRMGGDEFLIFTENTEREEIENRIKLAKAEIEEMKYHISVGVKKKTDDISFEELVNEAEKRMYLEKARYYQNKDGQHQESGVDDNKTEIYETGIKAVDAYLSVLQNKYYGACYVSLIEDKAVHIITPSHYLSVNNKEQSFSTVLKQYIHDSVKPEFHRTLHSFCQYDALERQLKEGHTPRLSYVKKDGDRVTLSVWSVPAKTSEETDTVWIFEKESGC